MSDRIRVAVLMGGRSFEHEVSLKSGQAILKNLGQERYQGFPVLLGKDGLWSVDGGAAVSLPQGLEQLARRADVVFLALHGPNGEDGSMQSVLGLLGIPYTGSDPYASSLAMNKPRAKDVYRQAGLTTPAYIEFRDEGESWEDSEKRLSGFAEQWGFPLVVKTTCLGSSVGVDIAKDSARLGELVRQNMIYSGHVMVEQYIRGVELTAPVLFDPYRRELLSLPLIEIRPQVSQWFDFRAKYEKGGSLEICPAPVSEELTRKVQEIGRKAHQALGCQGMSRTDVLVDAQGTCYAIETNTIPGFTQTSLLPQAAQAYGLSFESVVDYLVQESLQRKSYLQV